MTVRPARTIKTLTRLANSKHGNPRWEVTFTDGDTFDTAADAQVGYMINNREYQGVQLDVTLTKGFITHVKVA
ncbi:MAG: hypothetical protein LC723_06435 [Actinobacteria bacterium]|nr:hypothetical protein [Actinomycetota bacterium]